MDQFTKNLRSYEREKSAELVNRLAQQNPQIRTDILHHFSTADPALIFGKAQEHLMLVSDEKRKEVSDLVGIKLPVKTLQESIPKIKIQKEKLDWEYVQSQARPEFMTREELSAYWAPYFSHKESREAVIDLFWNWKKSPIKTPANIDELDANTTLEAPADNWDGFGMSLDREPIHEKIKRFLDPSIRRKYSASYKFSNVRKQHGNPLKFRILRRLLGEMGFLGSGEVITFPREFFKSSAEEYGASTQIEIDMERFESLFIFIINELSNVSANLQWFSGVGQDLEIPPALKPQWERLRELAQLGGFLNVDAQLESSVAALVSYNYPTLVNRHSQEKARKIQKSEVTFFPSPPEPKPVEDLSPPKMITFAMNKKVAEKFGFEPDIKIDCHVDYVKEIWSSPDDDPIYLMIKDKPVQITAKMFRLIFHRSELPTEAELENRKVIPLRPK